MIRAQDVAKLRADTGAGMMDAKKALVAAEGDFEQAKAALQAKYAEKAEKKSDRDTSEGVIGTYVHGGKIGVMVALACETDFVARNEAFQELAQNLAVHVAALVEDGTSVEDILTQTYIKDPSMTVGELIKTKIATIGENIQFKSYSKLSL